MNKTSTRESLLFKFRCFNLYYFRTKPLSNSCHGTLETPENFRYVLGSICNGDMILFNIIRLLVHNSIKLNSILPLSQFITLMYTGNLRAYLLAKDYAPAIENEMDLFHSGGKIFFPKPFLATVDAGE